MKIIKIKTGELQGWWLKVQLTKVIELQGPYKSKLEAEKALSRKFSKYWRKAAIS